MLAAVAEVASRMVTHRRTFRNGIPNKESANIEQMEEKKKKKKTKKTKKKKMKKLTLSSARWVLLTVFDAVVDDDVSCCHVRP